MPFDPYHRWLGIRDEEQPPNHYKLLGLELFEADPDVISTAADRQMAHVRRYQNGPHSATSQKVLNELAVAKLCLLDAAQKSKYDRWLQSRAQRKTPTPSAIVVETTSPATAEESLSLAPKVTPSYTRSPQLAANRLRHSRQKSVFPWVIGGLSLLLLLAVPAVLYLMKTIPPDLSGGLVDVGNGELPDEPPSPSQPKVEMTSEVPDTSMPESSPEQPPSVVEANDYTPKRQRPDEDATDSSADNRVSQSTEATSPPPESPSAEQGEGRVESDDGSTLPAVATPAVVQAPVPLEIEVEKSRQQFKKIFGQRWEAALAAEDSQAAKKLAGELFQRGRQTVDNLVVKYVYFEAALRLAIRSGNPAVATQTADELARHFDLDPITAAVSAVEASWREIGKLTRTQTVEASARFCEGVLPLVEQALERDDFEQANRLLKTLSAAAKRARGRFPSTDQRVNALRQKWQHWRQLHTKVEAARRQLSVASEEPSLQRSKIANANWTVGHYYGLVKADMKTAAPYLIASGHSELASIATIEQSAAEADAETQLGLAKQWLSLAKTGRTLFNKPLDDLAIQTAYRRAQFWLHSALPLLADLDRGECEALLAEATAGIQAAKDGRDIPQHAITFDGRKSRLLVPAFRYDGNMPLAIEVLLKPASASASYSTSATILANATARSGFRLSAEGGVWQFRFATQDDGEMSVRLPSRLRAGEWTRLLASYDGQQISLQQDDSQAVRIRTATRHTPSLRPLSVGASITNPNEPGNAFFRGDIAVIRIFFSSPEAQPVLTIGPEQVNNGGSGVNPVAAETY